LATHLNEFDENNLQLIWQTGKTTAEEFKQKASGRKNIWCDAFITKMEMAYAAADIVISRAGAMAVTEICVTQKPCVFVPFPLAAEDHQTANAKHLVDKNAALMVKDDQAKETLVKTIIDLSKNKPLQEQLKINITPLGIKNADMVIAKNILNSIQ
jgi:UDP-N-acetylglucosamine--N-acetylmuramyl-(pentapeptide) pyrophosphoryl-undecaprenol N-acetylglucosamine transferase